MPEAKQTKDKDYEFLSYWTFEAVEYDRDMAWKAGKGWIAIGAKVAARHDTNKNEKDVLRKGQSITVSETNFKLVRKA
ncbi:hypothetical protein IFR05_012836 [Cadophora sp. M221]|nr:hypothetical protein IFR05_012836 [Cadophora sp. M221]